MPFFPNYFKSRGTVKAKLLKDTFATQETAEFVDDVTAYAVSGTNVSDVTASVANSVNGGVVSWTVTNVSWTAVTCTNVGYVVIYLDTGDTSTSPVISYVDVRVDSGGGVLVGRNIVNDDLTVTYNANEFRFYVW